MKLKDLRILVFAGLAALASSSVWAQPGLPDGKMPPPPPCPYLSQQMDSGNILAAADALGFELAKKYRELGAECESLSPDKGRIEQLSREIGELRGKLLLIRLDLRKGMNGKCPAMRGEAGQPFDKPAPPREFQGKMPPRGGCPYAGQINGKREAPQPGCPAGSWGKEKAAGHGGPAWR